MAKIILLSIAYFKGSSPKLYLGIRWRNGYGYSNEWSQTQGFDAFSKDELKNFWVDWHINRKDFGVLSKDYLEKMENDIKSEFSPG
ncbi:MAG: hypothetical protein ACOCUL_03815 [Bacteroidota bacterium]